MNPPHTTLFNEKHSNANTAELLYNWTLTTATQGANVLKRRENRGAEVPDTSPHTGNTDTVNCEITERHVHTSRNKPLAKRGWR